MPNNRADSLDGPTRSATAHAGQAADVVVPGLTVLCHPDAGRVGEVAKLPVLLSGGTEEFSRREPYFAQPEGGAQRPLADARLSRTPLSFRGAERGAVVLDRGASSMELTIDGHPFEETRIFQRQDLERGVALVLVKRIAVLLHLTEAMPPGWTEHTLVGKSIAMVHLRREIERVADLKFAILLRGATGTGKELVARALHDTGPRRGGPYVEVNLGAIPPDLAAAELFGAKKGAYTGADRRRTGYFQRAQGGTLFLDEIGEAPLKVQIPLLRALDTGQVQPVGSEKCERVDVRVVAATDADLEAAVRAGRFRSPLLHRLASYEIELPPIAERQGDFGRLFFHFLRQELEEIGEPERLETPGGWVDAELVARLASYSWPGNVRQLKNTVRQLVVASRGKERMVGVARVERLFESDVGDTDTEKKRVTSSSHVDPENLKRDEVLAVLQRHRWSIGHAAKELGVARASLYKWVDRQPDIRKASELGRKEIVCVYEDCVGQLDAMADILKVSKRALKQQMTKLGLR